MGNAEVAIAYGDGVGPEIMKATLNILHAAGAELKLHEVDVGEKVYLSGQKAGIAPSAWEVLRGCKVFLKAPITTPQGGGYRSLNVTIRSAFGLFANIRPCVAYAPCVDTKYPGMDVVIVRENEEDLYTGLEYRPSQESFHALKIITQSGCEKIVRYAFEYAKTNGRKKVTCFTKDNILKMTDGLFHKTFDEIAKEYPEITPEHWIIDIGAAKMTDTPENFDVLVMPNLYGDILSDIAAQIAGSVGLAGSANIGEHFAMFEAIHGSAPRRANQNLANPSGLLLASVMMLVHLGKQATAELIHNAWLKTLEEGLHTYDIFEEKKSREKVGTKEFSQEVIKRLGQKPEILKPVHYAQASSFVVNKRHMPQTKTKKELCGVDLFIQTEKNPDELAKLVRSIEPFELVEIASRGAVIWPEKQPETHVGDLLRLRFMAKREVQTKEVPKLLDALENQHLQVCSHAALFTYNGQAGFSQSGAE